MMTSKRGINSLLIIKIGQSRIGRRLFGQMKHQLYVVFDEEDIESGEHLKSDI